jgi:hypothetical protein
MDRSAVTFSNLTNDQINEVQALESKINSSNTKGQETILIAYATPE